MLGAPVMDVMNFCWGLKVGGRGTEIPVVQKLKHFNMCETLFCPQFAVFIVEIYDTYFCRI